MSENEIMKFIQNGKKAMKNQNKYAGRYTKHILEKVMITVSNGNLS